MAFNKQKVMNAARRQAAKGNLEKAIREYTRVVEDDPKDVRVWLKIADLYAKQDDKQGACQTYQKVARFYSDQGFYLKAVAVYKQILKVDPRLVEMNLKLAELYRQLGLKSDAVQHFEHVAAHFHREGNIEAALATVRQLVEIDPENVATRIKLAELYSKQEMTAEAITEFQIASDQLKALNRQDDYLKVAERLLWHSPDNVALAKELAGHYLRRRDAKRAIPKLQLSFKANPKDHETLTMLAQAFQEMEQNAKAVSVLRELAHAHEEENDQANAKAVYRQILRLAPSDEEAVKKTGGVAKARANTGSGLASMKAPEVEEIQDIDAVVDDGDFGTGESSAAGEMHAEEIERVLKETDVYIKYGLHQKALGHLDRIFELDPRNTEARERKKDILIELGRESEAVSELVSLADFVSAHDMQAAERFLREALAIDGTNDKALSLAEKLNIEVAAGDDVEIVDEIGNSQGGYAPTAGAGGGVVAVNEEASQRVNSRGMTFAPSGSMTKDADGPAFNPADARAFDADLPPRSQYPQGGNYYPIPADMLDPGESPQPASAKNGKTNGSVAAAAKSPAPPPPPSSPPEFDVELEAPAAKGSSPQLDTSGADLADDLFGEVEDEAWDKIPDPDPDAAAAFDAELRVASEGVSRKPGKTGAIPLAEALDKDFDERQPPGLTETGNSLEFELGIDPLTDYGAMSADIVDDDVGAAPPVSPSAAAIPDFPPAPAADESPEFSLDEPEEIEEFEEVEEVEEVEEFSFAGDDDQPVTGTGAVSLEDDLEEVDFFISQQLFDEARDILTGLLARYPKNPQVNAKVDELEEIVGAAGAKTVHEEDDGGLSPEEVEQHYDLGLAYKDMGLYEEAIRAFRKAASDGKREVDSRMMIGMCNKADGDLDAAIEEFKSALASQTITSQQRLVLEYELAGSYEAKNDSASALKHFDRVMQQDANYLDAAQRAAHLRGQ